MNSTKEIKVSFPSERGWFWDGRKMAHNGERVTGTLIRLGKTMSRVWPDASGPMLEKGRCNYQRVATSDLSYE